jgi:opacity protein-like surface antigen
MRLVTRFLPLLAVLTWLTLSALPASAEWFADLYAGPAFSQSRTVEVNSPDIGRTATQSDVKTDTNLAFGGRAGYWFELEPVIGLGLDAFHFSPNTSKQTVTRSVCLSGVCTTSRFEDKGGDADVTAVGLDVWLRYPLLTSPQFPKGQLQPYFTAGPAVFIAHVENNGFTPPQQTASDTSIGVKTALGLAWQFLPNLAVFGEYRFTHFRPEFHFTDAFLGRTTTTSNSNQQYLLFGASFRF